MPLGPSQRRRRNGGVAEELQPFTHKENAAGEAAAFSKLNAIAAEAYFGTNKLTKGARTYVPRGLVRTSVKGARTLVFVSFERTDVVGASTTVVRLRRRQPTSCTVPLLAEGIVNPEG